MRKRPESRIRSLRKGADMQVKVEIKSLDEVKSWLKSIPEKQLPFALSKAVNDTAKEVKAELVNEMKRVFDRPTNYTLNSVFIKPATKRDLTAIVGFKEWGGKGTPASKYLAPQMFGGNRGLKRSERSLQRAGLLPSGMYWTPGKGARLNSHGNISGGQITQILSVLQASVDTAQNMTARSRVKNRKPREYFVGKPGGGRLPLGVYERRGRKIKPVLVFVKSPNYKPRFLFFETAEKTVNKVWLQKMGEAIQYALATAR